MIRKRNEQNGVLPKKLPGLFLVIIFFLFFFVAYVTIKEVVNRRQLDQQIAQLNNQIVDLQLEQENFLAEIEDYKSDFYIEKEARVKMNLKKDGEQVAVVKLEDVNKVREQNELNIKNNQSQGSNPVKWWNYFFGEKM